MARGDAPRADEPALGELARRVVADGRAAVTAEIGVAKAIAAYRLAGVKLGAPLLLVALFLMQATVTALLVGLILALTPRIGPGWATLLVIGVALAAIGLLAWIGVRKLASLWTPLPPEELTP